MKCGGKGKAFEKPGPHDRFKTGIRLIAKELAMERGHAPQFQLVADAIEEHGASDGWKRRARVDVTPFYLAAVQGKAPGLVSSNCGKCKGKSGADGHAHSAFCKTNPKAKDKDKKPMQKVLSVLRKIAHEASAAGMMVRRRAPFVS